MDHLGKVKIYLESGNVVSGDYLKGWVVIKCNSDGHKVVLTTSGTESLKTTQFSGNTSEKSSTVFEHSETLSPKTSRIEETFPFKLKIPRFAPSSFSLNHVDEPHERKIDVSVVYKISAYIETTSGKIAEKSKKFVVLSPKTRENMKNESSCKNSLKSCWCIPRGEASISVKKTEENNSFSDNNFKYTMTISSTANKKLESIVAQVVFDFFSKVEGEKAVKVRRTLTRVVPNLADFKTELEKNLDVSIDLDFSASDEKSSDIFSSCKSRYFQSRVFLKILTTYDVGWRSKYFELDHEVHVSPKRSSEVNALNDQEEEFHKLKTIVINEANSKYYSE